MTLTKQTTLMMIVALSTIFICTFIITVYLSKNYFEEQLQHNTQDTATALGLSMSKASNKKIDTITMLQMISAVFDRGYFSNIYVRNNQGNILVKRYLKANQHDVPNWFATLVRIRNDEQSALIMNGWQQVGEVVVQTDNALAYMALWQTTKKLFLLFFLTTLLIIVLSVLYIKVMFKPLRLIIRQAEDIGRKNLYTLDKRPKLKELYQLSTTMNSMVTKLKVFFTLQIEETERLRAKAYQDSLTGVGNRRYFFQQFNEYLGDESYFLPGFLFLIELSGLSEFNQNHSYQQGDQVLVGVCQLLDDSFLHQHLYLLARLDGPSFAVVILEKDMRVIESLADETSKNIEKFIKNKDKVLSCYIGVARCEFSEAPANLLAVVDKLKNKARKQGVGYCVEPDKANTLPISDKTWRESIEEAIQKKHFHFYAQPVRSNQGVYHKECYIKLLHDTNEIAASHFFPIVEQYSLGGEIDQLVLEEVATIKDEAIFALNLSTCTVGNEKKQSQFLLLVKQLTQHSQIKIHFEFSEYMIAQYLTTVVPLIDGLVKLGHAVGIDRVGSTLTPLTFLKELDIAYLKLDGNLSKDIAKNKLKQDIITNWITLTQRLDVTLIATAVESEGQWRTLNALGITHFQGNYIRSPSLIDES